MIDFHTHFIPEEVFIWIKENKQTINAKWNKSPNCKNEFLIVNNKWGFELKQEFVNMEL